jgi:hypothetical protein
MSARFPAHCGHFGGASILGKRISGLGSLSPRFGKAVAFRHGYRRD